MDKVIHLIKNEAELAKAQTEMGRLLEISNGGSQRTAEQESRLDVLAVLIRFYEDEHWALSLPDPIAAIQYRMDELGLQQSDLMDEFGNKTTASQIMNRKRPLTLPIIRRLSARLALPIAVLAQEYPVTNGEAEKPRRMSARG